MHILLALVGILGAAAFWWYRLRNISEAASEIADVAGRVRGTIRRRNLRNKAAQSPFTAIDNPVVGGATIMIAIATECGRFDANAEQALREGLAAVAGPELIDEAVVYGKWATGQVAEASTAVKLVSPLVASRLTMQEREEFLAMTAGAARAGGADEAMLREQLRRLRQQLELPVER